MIQRIMTKTESISIFRDIEEFAKNIPNYGSIIGIDYGAKKIGLAVSSPDRVISLPLALIENNNKVFDEILSSIRSKKTVGLVLGLPVNMDGSESPSSEKIYQFAKKISEKTNLPIYLQDERRTSRAADSLLLIAGFSRKKRNALDDSIAASLILETCLQRIQVSNIKYYTS